MLKEAVNTFFPNAYSSISEYKEEQKQYTELEATYWPLKLICPKPLWNFISGHRKSLSQCMQDYWVMNSVFHNKRDGFFLDIGSTDGITINNTFLLEKRLGWKGICIEANPHYYKTLKRNRKCTCLNLCVGEAGETVEFKLDNIYSGITETSTDNGSKEKIESSLDNAETFVAETVPLIDILKENQAPKVIDYLSIDVEGYEEKILRNFPFEEYRFSAITIERPSDTLHSIFIHNGYILVMKAYWGKSENVWIDSFYVHESKLPDIGGQVYRDLYCSNHFSIAIQNEVWKS